MKKRLLGLWTPLRGQRRATSVPSFGISVILLISVSIYSPSCHGAQPFYTDIGKGAHPPQGLVPGPVKLISPHALEEKVRQLAHQKQHSPFQDSGSRGPDAISEGLAMSYLSKVPSHIENSELEPGALSALSGVEGDGAGSQTSSIRSLLGILQKNPPDALRTTACFPQDQGLLSSDNQQMPSYIQRIVEARGTDFDEGVTNRHSENGGLSGLERPSSDLVFDPSIRPLPNDTFAGPGRALGTAPLSAPDAGVDSLLQTELQKERNRGVKYSFGDQTLPPKFKRRSLLDKLLRRGSSHKEKPPLKASAASQDKTPIVYELTGPLTGQYVKKGDGSLVPVSENGMDFDIEVILDKQESRQIQQQMMDQNMAKTYGNSSMKSLLRPPSIRKPIPSSVADRTVAPAKGCFSCFAPRTRAPQIKDQEAGLLENITETEYEETQDQDSEEQVSCGGKDLRMGGSPVDIRDACSQSEESKDGGNEAFFDQKRSSSQRIYSEAGDPVKANQLAFCAAANVCPKDATPEERKKILQLKMREQRWRQDLPKEDEGALRPSLEKHLRQSGVIQPQKKIVHE